MHARYALESAHIGSRIGQTENSLNAEWNLVEPTGVYVPVNESAVVVVGILRVVRRLEICTVERDPQLLRFEQLPECLMYTWILPVIPQRLVLINLHHSTG